MKVRLSVEYEVDDKNPELEKLAIEIIRAEGDVFAEVVKKKLSAAGADVTSFRAEYE
jgi:hypothetical protein